MLDKRELRSHMAKHGDTQRSLAEAMGISLSRLNAKINETGGAEFKKTEMAFIRVRYGLAPEAVDAIFFGRDMS